MKKILLADRSSSIGRMIAGMLAGEGIEVTAVTDGYAAERSLNENQPDLVLADVFLLGKNGYEICRLIKQDTRFSSLPVILLVGSFEPFDAAAAAGLGADGKLTKPMEPAGLIDMVRRFLGGGAPSAETDDPPLTAVAGEAAVMDTASDADPEATTPPVPIQPMPDSAS